MRASMASIAANRSLVAMTARPMQTEVVALLYDSPVHSWSTHCPQIAPWSVPSVQIKYRYLDNFGDCVLMQTAKWLTLRVRKAGAGMNLGIAGLFLTLSFAHSAVNICRVCRCEGAPDNPLFYPCKCSGSIKYVHEDWYAAMVAC